LEEYSPDGKKGQGPALQLSTTHENVTYLRSMKMSHQALGSGCLTSLFGGISFIFAVCHLNRRFFPGA
jgi:hypothetical protein